MESKGYSDNLSVPDAKQVFKDMVILIVEDEETSYLFLNEFLSRKCKEILRAKNGKEALSLLKSRSEINLVLMDLKMPEMDGFTATRKIKKLKPGLVVIAQTAFSTREYMERASKAGCDDYIAKPILKDELTRVVFRHLPGK